MTSRRVLVLAHSGSARSGTSAGSSSVSMVNVRQPRAMTKPEVLRATTSTVIEVSLGRSSKTSLWAGSRG